MDPVAPGPAADSVAADPAPPTISAARDAATRGDFAAFDEAHLASRSYVPARLEIQLQPVPRINVTIIDIATGRTESFGYPCAGVGCTVTTDAQVTTLITALNTANLGTRSLWRRVFDRLILDFASRFVGGATVQ